MRTRLTALLLAVVVTASPLEAAWAQSQAASPFEVVPRRARESRSHRLAWTLALGGVALVAASFPLSAEADRRYERYLTETDVARIDERFAATTRMDKIASTSLLGGELLLATAVWLRFVHQPPESRVTLAVMPERCAVRLRF